jgi:glutamate synthase (NADPH/NADH) large chain
MKLKAQAAGRQWRVAERVQILIETARAAPDVPRIWPPTTVFKKYHQVFGYTREDIDVLITPHGRGDENPIGSIWAWTCRWPCSAYSPNT